MPRKQSGEPSAKKPARARKSPTAKRSVKTPASKTATTPQAPANSYNEEHLRERAYYIYLERRNSGHSGDQVFDWRQAE